MIELVEYLTALLEYINPYTPYSYNLSIHTYIENYTCTRFQCGAISATGSVATEQSGPINII